MKKSDLTLLLLALALIIAAIITFMRGGEKSRHGIGQNKPGSTLAYERLPYQNVIVQHITPMRASLT